MSGVTSRGPLLAVFLTVLIDLLGFGIIIPLLPVYTKAYGASELELGLLFATFSGMQLLFAPFWGAVSDRFGRRVVIVGGLCGTAASYVLFAFADSMPLLFASRLLAGFFGANIATAQAYIADVTAPEDRARGMGLIGAAFGIGFTIGPFVGGELTDLVGLWAPGAAAATLSLAAATFAWRNLRGPARPPVPRVPLHVQLREALQNPRFGVLVLLVYLTVFAFACFEAMFTRFGLAHFPGVFGVPVPIADATFDQVMRSAPIAGRYLAFVGVISALIQGGLTRRLVRRYGEHRLIVVGPLVLGVSLAIVGLAPVLPLAPGGQWAVVIVGCCVMPVGFGLANPSLASLLSRNAPVEHQGAHLGISQSASSFARMTAPPVAGALFGTLGAASPFWGAAAVLALATLIAAGYRRRHAPAR
jgi:MFS family permease